MRELVLVLRGARVIDPSRGLDETADVVVEGTRIGRIGRDAAMGIAPSEAVRVVDARGCWIAPGFVDLHAHLREPGDEEEEDVASGLAAAAAGGFTTVCTMPNTRPVIDDAHRVRSLRERAAAVGGPRLRPMAAVTQGSEGRALTDARALREAGAVGLSDDGRCVADAALMREALRQAREHDLLISQHCEDPSMTRGAPIHDGEVSRRLGVRGWPREAEDVIVARDLVLAEATGARYHVAHVSSLGAVRLLREAKARGLRVSAEVTPHHLLLTDEAVLLYGAQCKVNPPLRSEADRAALREALADGTLDCIATDHAPHRPSEKACPLEQAAFGITGLETALAVLLDLVRDGTLTPMRLLEALSTAPARILGDADAGTLREGARADLVVIDPARTWTVTPERLRGKSHNGPWLGRTLTGRVVMTIVEGRIVHEVPA
ncbi:MAG: dihydroorotase [Myxococcota bacterium]|nr:dihydroorotase [Myxococcota bacterium]MDW8363527.1 dihydroorotase [Myxococcales bacterium]